MTYFNNYKTISFLCAKETSSIDLSFTHTKKREKLIISFVGYIYTFT